MSCKAVGRTKSKAVELSKEDEKLSDDEKIEKAQHLVTEKTYQEMKDIIAEEVTNCEAKLIRQTRHYQGKTMTIFFQHVFKITNRNCFNGASYDKLICNDAPADCKAAYQLR